MANIATPTLTLDQVISVAEQAIERRGFAGRTITVPVGHRDDPSYQQAIAPLVASVRELTGWPHMQFFVDNYTLDRAGASAATDRYNWIVVRAQTTEMAVLHEVAHVRCATTGEHGHTPLFARTLTALYATHLGADAAAAFWSIVGPEVDAITVTTPVWPAT